MVSGTQPAERHYHQAQTLLDSLAAEFPQTPAYRDELATCHHDEGLFYQSMSCIDRAESEYLKAQALWEKLVGTYPQDAGYGGKFADCLNSLANLYNITGRKDRAEKLHLRVQDLWTRLAARYPQNDAYQVALAMSRLSPGPPGPEAGRQESGHQVGHEGHYHAQPRPAQGTPQRAGVHPPAGVVCPAMAYQSSGRNLEALADLWRYNALKKPAPRKPKPTP